LNHERAPGLRAIFTNTFRYLPTTGEVTITFGRFEGSPPTPPGAPPTLVDEAEVVMTYMQLKSFYEHLAAFLAVYEQELGPIQTPASLQPDMNLINTFVSNLKNAWGR
jgi:hypothetical protein